MTAASLEARPFFFVCVQVQTALYSFDALKVPADIQKVNCSSEAYDKQLFDRIFVADAVERMLGVDLSQQDVPIPTAPPPATHSAPESAPAETKQASHSCLQ